MRFPLLLALASGVALGWTLYSDGYFPQNDVFLTYQIFHYVYSSIFLDGQLPLWEPYTSYGLPNAYEMVFTFTPANALRTLLGVLFRISDIKLLFFGAVGLNFAMIGIAAAYVTRELSGKWRARSTGCRGHAAQRIYGDHALRLPILTDVPLHDPLPRALPQDEARHLSLRSRPGTSGELYGQGPYLVIPEFYVACSLRSWQGCATWHMAAEWRRILRACSRHRPWRWLR